MRTSARRFSSSRQPRAPRTGWLGLLRVLCLVPLLLASGLARADELLVIGHAGLGRMDAQLVQKIFTGRVIELGGQPLVAVNQIGGSPARARFLSLFLNQDEEKYVAYWTVRKFIGKGSPPRELGGTAEILAFVQSTPGAVAYIDAAELHPGVNVVAKR